MISDEAVEAAEEYLSLLMADPNGDYTMEARSILEAAAPHMLREAQELAWAKGATAAGLNLMALYAEGINPNPYRSQG